MSSLRHYTKEELVKLKKKYDMQVSKEAIEEIKHTIDLDEEIERLNNNWKELRQWIINHNHNENTNEHYLVVDYGELLNKLQELDKVEENK